MKYLEPTPPSPDEIIAFARAKNTPLGIFAAIKIGSWDLQNQDSYYLRTRAHEAIHMFVTWRDCYNLGNIPAISKDLGFRNVEHLKDIFNENNVKLESNFLKLGELKPVSAEIFNFPNQSANVKKIEPQKKTNPAARAEFSKLLAKIKA